MTNPLNRARTQRAIALLFLALVLVGAIAELVRSFEAANAAAQIGALTAPAQHGPVTRPRAGEQR